MRHLLIILLGLFISNVVLAEDATVEMLKNVGG